MRKLDLDVYDALSCDERRYNPRRKSRVSPKHERAMRKYRGADRSVTLSGVIAPPTKNAAKTAFAAQKPRLSTSTPVVLTGNVVKVPGIYG